MEYRQPVIISLLLFIILEFFYDIMLPTAFGLSYTVFVFILFVQRLGKTVPILELILLIACMQWVMGPYIAYALGNNHYKYFMSLPEEVYMAFIDQCLLALSAGMILWSRILNRLNKKRASATEGAILDQRVAFITMIAGLGAHTVSGFFTSEFRFVFFLIDGMQFISVFYFFHFRHKWRWIVLFAVVLINFGISLSQGFFHNIIIWLVLIFIYLNLYYRMSLVYKLTIISLGLFFIYLLQSIKGDYRSSLSTDRHIPYDQKESNTEVFTEMIVSKAMEEEAADTSILEVINARFNQGWIISRVMNYVPQYEPFANGETIKNAIVSSFVPRIFAPEKKKAGGIENFERFTGYTLVGTSMGVSLVGEAYANYGRIGALYFLFIWGFFLSSVLVFILYVNTVYPTLWLWIPLMFTQVIKAETDLVVVLNHLTKSLFLVLVLFWISKRFFNIRI